MPEILVYELSAITVDYEWNCRSRSRATSEGKSPEDGDGDPDAPGVEGLAAAFEVEGQKEPVECYRDPVSAKVRLIIGFRRYSAAQYLFKRKRSIKGLESGQILAVVHEDMTLEEAYEANFAENAHRLNLKAPDLAFGIGRLIKRVKLTQEVIAARYGISTYHVSHLAKIAQDLKPTLFDQWRQSPIKRLTVADVLTIAKLPEPEQDAAYGNALATKEADKKPQNSAWIRTACKQAAKTGKLLGALSRDGLIDLDEGMDWAANVRKFVKFRVVFNKLIVGPKICGRIAETLAHAFTEERRRPADPDIVQQGEYDEEDSGPINQFV